MFYSVSIVVAVWRRCRQVGPKLLLVAIPYLTLPVASGQALPAPTVTLDPVLKPNQKYIPGIRGEGSQRVLAAIASQRGNSADFVENELLVFTNDFLAVQQMAIRWKGQILASVDFREGRFKNVPGMHLIRITSSLANPARLSSDLQAVNKGRTANLRVSSQGGLVTLAAAAMENARGIQVGLNWVLRPSSIRNRQAREGAGPFNGPSGTNYGSDPFRWPYFNQGSNQDIGVADAWRALVAADKVRNKVGVLIVDQGFDPNESPGIPNRDFPPNTVLPVGTAGVAGTANCSSGNPCPWHGTDVALAGFAVPGNDFGAAGPGGLVADLTLVSTPSLDVFEIFRFLESLISSLIRGPRIINISASSHVPAGVCLAVCPALDLISVAFRAANILTIASAGNQGQNPDEADVDREDCLGWTCWEAGAEIPCEINGVLCVGGLDWDSKSRHPSSSFGSKSSDPSNRATVRMFAPFNVWTNNPHNGPNVTLKGGTSFSAPFVAGVAAMVMAANPNLSGDDVDGILTRTAHSSPDSTVPRYVNAFEAVKAALGGSVPPTLTLISPSSSVTRPQDHWIEFEARAVSGDYQNISSAITWRSDVASDNPLPMGRYWFVNDGANPLRTLPPGTRNITASVTDGGWTDSSTVSVTVTEVPVQVRIAQPSSEPSSTSTRAFPGGSFLLIGTSQWLGGRSLPDSGVHWFLDNTSGTPIANGHGPIRIAANTICASPPCRRTLIFQGSNGRTSAEARIDVFVDPTPVGPPPTATIISPANNATFPGQFVTCVPTVPRPGMPSLPKYSATLTLQGHAVDQNGTAIPGSDLTWRKHRVDGPIIGTGTTLNATFVETHLNPPPQPISVTIFLVARDSQRATGSASSTITITTPFASCP